MKLTEKKITYSLLIAIISIVIILICKSEILVKDNSPDRSNTIIIRDHGSFLFGPSEISIVAKKNTIFGLLSLSKYKTQIYNDGGKISEEWNIDITWLDENTATVMLDGDEQTPERINIKFSDDNVSINVNITE